MNNEELLIKLKDIESYKEIDMELLFLDTETGGLNPRVNSLLQVGMVAYADGQIINSTEFSIKEENYNICAAAMKYNGLDLYEDIYKNGVSKKEALCIIQRFCRNHFSGLPILVGHNPSIDKYIIRELFKQENLEMDKFISHRMIDTMSIMWGLYTAGKLPIEKLPIKACSSSGAFKYFGIEVEKRHHALDDSLATVKLYEELICILRGI